MIQQEFVDTVAGAAMNYGEAVTQAAVQELSVWDLTMRGGWIMIPLAILSLVCIYIYLWNAVWLCAMPRRKIIRSWTAYANISMTAKSRAPAVCVRKLTHHTARLIGKGISRIGRPMNDVLVTIENTGNIEIATLEKGLPWATTAAGAPMIGFLGTVIGMVQAFYNLASAGSEREYRCPCRRYLCRACHHCRRSDCRHHRSFCLQLSCGAHQQGDECP